MDMIERVARAIDEVELFSRFNDWTSDRVEGLPVEICRYGVEGEEDIVVVARFGGAITEAEALADVVSEHRARAAIEALREPTDAMIEAGVAADFGKTLGERVANCHAAMIDAALSPSI